MDTVAETTSSVNWKSEYQQRASATRRRRQAAGRYATPAQKAALKRYINGGLKALLPGDDELIASHPQMRGFRVNWSPSGASPVTGGPDDWR